MTLHPARVVASVLLIAGGLVVGVTALAIVTREAPRRCRDGRPVRPTPLLLADLIAVLPVHRHLRRRRVSWPPSGSSLGKPWADDVALGTATVAVIVGAIGLILLAIGRDPFASLPPPARPPTGSPSSAPSRALYLFIIVAVAVARLPAAHLAGAAA